MKNQMTKSLRVLLAASLLTSTFAQAQSVSVPGAGDTNAWVSLIYSRIQNKALVGKVNEKNIVHFEECETPALADGQKLTIDSITNCQVLDGVSFTGDEASVHRINNAFPGELRAAFRATQQGRLDRFDQDNDNLTFITVATSMVGMGISAVSVTTLWSRLAEGRLAAGGLYGALATLGVGATTGLVFYGLHNTAKDRAERRQVFSLEDRVVEAMRENRGQKDVVLDEKLTPELYPAVRTALIQSIQRANTL